MEEVRPLPWRVLLLGGVSGTGKTTTAKAISARLSVAWVQVDDLRLALERTLTTIPPDLKDLRFFHRPDVWRLPPEVLCAGLINVGHAMTPAIEVVTENHDDQGDPAVIEGDGILPSLFDRPSIQSRVDAGRVRGVFLVEDDMEALAHNMLARGRGFDRRMTAAQQKEVEAKSRFGCWLEAEAASRGLPVVRPRPWESLVDRILAAAR